MSAGPGDRVAAIVGGGVIGGGWAARFLLHGFTVRVYDPHPDAPKHLDSVLENARASLPALADAPMPPEGTFTFCDTIGDAVTPAGWVQESVPEDLSLKHKVLAEIEAHASPETLIGSSTSGFRPSQLQDNARHPERIFVAHPFNPVYLLPLAELVPGSAVPGAIRERAAGVLRAIGMYPLHVRNEIDAHIADRLLEAVWREALWLVRDDVATTAEIDDAIRFGFGLRWAQMGLFETYRLAGGEAGMKRFIAQFGPCLSWPWTRLTDMPDLTGELVDKIAAQSDAQSGSRPIRELERIRDRNLVGILRALKERDWGAGAFLREHDGRLARVAPDRAPSGIDSGAPAPLRLLDLTVLPAWIDYNGHMTEFRYGQVFSDSCDRLLTMIGMNAEYLKTTGGWYTVETHNTMVSEAGVNDRIYSTAQLLMADERKLHVFFRVHARADDRLLATSEALYLHVGRASGRVSPAGPGFLASARALVQAHAQLPVPETVGRHVGQRLARV